MGYESYDQEWDETWKENEAPKMGDKVLCLGPEVYAGEVVETFCRGSETFFVIQLEDGSVDEFAEEDVLKRKMEAVA